MLRETTRLNDMGGRTLPAPPVLPPPIRAGPLPHDSVIVNCLAISRTLVGLWTLVKGLIAHRLLPLRSNQRLLPLLLLLQVLLKRKHI